LENGVFLEFAIFTESELAKFGIPGLRTIWAREGFVLPKLSENKPINRELTYYVNQGLSNLYVGALRMLRGERLAALVMIERSALSNFLTAYRIKNQIAVEDPFVIERRAESSLGLDFKKLAQGYEKLELSLLETLRFAEENFEVNQSIVQAIKELVHSK